MNDKWQAVLWFWARAFGIAVLTMLTYQLVPLFGRLMGDLELRCDRFSIPLTSCGLLAAMITGIWAYRNWQKL